MGKSIPFDRVVDIYDSTRELPPAVMSEVVRELARTMRMHGCRSVLDAGVGTGRFARPLQDAGFEVVGVDISDAMLEKAKGKTVRRLIRGDVRRMPFEDLSFDCATAMHVLHLIKEWRETLREIGRVSRVGLFSVTSDSPPTDSPGESYKRMLLETGWPTLHPGVHERDLVAILPPTESRTILAFREEHSADDALNLIEGRAYSFLFDVPEETHTRIMAAVRKDWTGKSYGSTREVRICMWERGLLLTAIDRLP